MEDDKIIKDFLTDALDIEQRKKNLEKLEENVKMIEDMNSLIKSLPRKQRRKILKDQSFSKMLREKFKNM